MSDQAVLIGADMIDTVDSVACELMNARIEDIYRIMFQDNAITMFTPDSSRAKEFVRKHCREMYIIMSQLVKCWGAKPIGRMTREDFATEYRPMLSFLMYANVLYPDSLLVLSPCTNGKDREMHAALRFAPRAPELIEVLGL